MTTISELLGLLRFPEGELRRFPGTIRFLEKLTELLGAASPTPTPQIQAQGDFELSDGPPAILAQDGGFAGVTRASQGHYEIELTAPVPIGYRPVVQITPLFDTDPILNAPIPFAFWYTIDASHFGVHVWTFTGPNADTDVGSVDGQDFSITVSYVPSV